MTRRWRSDEGSTIPLIVAFCALAIALTLVVAAASSLYLERKRLLALADSAAVVGAEAFPLGGVRVAGGQVDPRLRSADVKAAVAGFLEADRGDFESLRLERAASDDGRTATVTVSAVWRPPVVSIFLPEGMRVSATSTARSVFG